MQRVRSLKINSVIAYNDCSRRNTSLHEGPPLSRRSYENQFLRVFAQEMLQEAWHYRQTNSTLYQPTNQSEELKIEVLPWTGKVIAVYLGGD